MALRLDRKVWLYVLWGFAISLPFLAVAAVVLGIAQFLPDASEPETNATIELGLGSIVLITAACSLLASLLLRWSLVLPATALGHRMTIRESAALTRSNTMRLVGLGTATLFPYSVLAAAVEPKHFSFAAFLTLNGLVQALSILFTVFAVTLLSLMYRHFVPQALETRENLP